MGKLNALKYFVVRLVMIKLLIPEVSLCIEPLGQVLVIVIIFNSIDKVHVCSFQYGKVGEIDFRILVVPARQGIDVTKNGGLEPATVASEHFISKKGVHRYTNSTECPIHLSRGTVKSFCVYLTSFPLYSFPFR